MAMSALHMLFLSILVPFTDPKNKNMQKTMSVKGQTQMFLLGMLIWPILILAYLWFTIKGIRKVFDK
jgi:hypothetical protein